MYQPVSFSLSIILDRLFSFFRTIPSVCHKLTSVYLDKNNRLGNKCGTAQELSTRWTGVSAPNLVSFSGFFLFFAAVYVLFPCVIRLVDWMAAVCIYSFYF